MAIERPALPSMAHRAEFTDLPEEPRSWSAEGALASLLALVPLDDLPRTGWVLRGIEAPESIAGHVVGVAHVALAMAPQVRPTLDLGRVLAMALVHDAPEAISGDLPLPAARHLPPGAKKTMEAGIARDLLGPLSTAAVDAYAEYIDQGTREARFVKQCDRIQLGVRLVAYERSGRRGLDEFWRGLAVDSESEFPAADALLNALMAARAVV
ncbi:MAG: putative hydrolase of HD superfamily [Planctomycetota bacterium]|jgi:putative hydrolase of HD superfamily